MRARVLVVLIAAGACTRQAPLDRPTAPPPVETTANATPTTTTEDAGATETLAGFPEIVELRDGSELVGVVSVPLGAHEPRPIMIALHGGSDRPERACPAWRIAADAYPFVVCPHGWGGNEARLGWRGPADSKARIARAVALVKAKFGAWVKESSTMVLAGFSMGASEVARIAATDPRTYRRIVIGDSAHDPRPAMTFSHAWVSGGGERAMFMCTTSGCEPSMRAAAKKASAEKASARLVVAPTQVHALSARAAESLRRDWAWLVEGAEGWEAYASASRAPSTSEGRTESFEPTP